MNKIKVLGAFSVFLVVELAIVVTHPKLYWRSVRRTLGFGRYPFHAYPRSMDEKFLWRKVFDHDPTFTRISDKLEVREWLKETGLDLKMTPLLWCGTSAQDIPGQFLSGDVIIKANHDSASGIAMWQDPVPRDEVIERLENALERDYSASFGEWGYRDIPRKVFVEQRIGAEGVALNDLKFYTFGSRVERLTHIQNRPDGRFGQVFEPDHQGRFLRLDRPPEVCDGRLEVNLSGVFARAVSLARELGAPFDHMRVDLLEADGDLWLSEMTVYNQGGRLNGGGEFPDSQISRAWDLRRSWALRALPGGFLQRTYLRLLRYVLERNAVGAVPLAPA